MTKSQRARSSHSPQRGALQRAGPSIARWKGPPCVSNCNGAAVSWIRGSQPVDKFPRINRHPSEKLTDCLRTDNICRFSNSLSARCRPTSSLSSVCQSPIVTNLAEPSLLTASDKSASNSEIVLACLTLAQARVVLGGLPSVPSINGLSVPGPRATAARRPPATTPAPPGDNRASPSDRRILLWLHLL